MRLSRRTFLIAACGWPLSFVEVLPSRDSRDCLFVLDETLGDRMSLPRDARIAPLTGDAGWLWHERLRHEAARSSLAIGGLTRPADAFVLTRFAADLGMRAVQRTLDRNAVAWKLQHRTDSLE
jgi:hypothetical protein